ncbi:MAG: thioredoxin domain-containing protein [Dehalococcoidia bacterium]
MANRLIDETSPYLLQHAHNPVDWYPWGDEALSRARTEDKPILLSVGYSACHWCHVMERESFENSQIAQMMNDNFINIKVDREERPDVDAIYMQAVQTLTGRGGWPMTVFLTPDGRPFHGGTYYPPEDRHGMPGFPRVLTAIAQAYRERRGDVLSTASQLTERLQPAVPAGSATGHLSTAVLDEAAQRLASQFDAINGGFGGAPKFPAAMTLDFLLRHYVRTGNRHSLEMVEVSLDRMARGGIYDQIGGGFHRYAVDDVWLVPHFEKMLYDNALLTRLYLRAFQVTGNPFYRQIVEETIDYVLREMTDPAGGFYSSQDADSEGEEGKFFTWTISEMVQVLGPDETPLMARIFGVEPAGNFEHTNILHRPIDLTQVATETGIDAATLDERVVHARRTLFEARESRVRPNRDDKVLTAWNGMMLRALADAAAVLERDDYAAAALANAEFLLRDLRDGDRVLRTWKDGQAKLDGYLEDYALLVDGLLAVSSLTFDPRWLREAITVAGSMIDRFWETDPGVFFDTAGDAQALIVRPRDILDNATPSGNSVAAGVMLRLATLTGDADEARRATLILEGHQEAMGRYPTAFGELLGALDFAVGPVTEITLVGERQTPETRDLLREVYRRFRPLAVVVGRDPGDTKSPSLSPLFEGREQRAGTATAYVCIGYACSPPAVNRAELSRELETMGR